MKILKKITLINIVLLLIFNFANSQEIDKIKELYAKGQPVLVGTTSVEESEVLAKMLKATKLPHNVLKACVKGLESQKSPKILAAIRGKKISDIVLKRESK